MSDLMCLDNPSYRFGWPVAEIPTGKLPRAAEKIATIRWDWGPGHGRTDDYFLVQADDGWQLWLVDPSCAETTTLVVATSTALYTSLGEAAADLLRRYWSWSSSDGLDHFSTVSNTGVLDEPTIAALGERVWGGVTAH